MSDVIIVGDDVVVNFNSICFTLCSRATVIHVPTATGDSWIFKESGSGKIYYVSEGVSVTKLNKEPT